jgi:hypothetical protein
MFSFKRYEGSLMDTFLSSRYICEWQVVVSCLIIADPGGLAVGGEVLRPIACWDCEYLMLNIVVRRMDEEIDRRTDKQFVARFQTVIAVVLTLALMDT